MSKMAPLHNLELMLAVSCELRWAVHQSVYGWALPAWQSQDTCLLTWCWFPPELTSPQNQAKAAWPLLTQFWKLYSIAPAAFRGLQQAQYVIADTKGGDSMKGVTKNAVSLKTSIQHMNSSKMKDKKQDIKLHGHCHWSDTHKNGYVENTGKECTKLLELFCYCLHLFYHNFSFIVLIVYI